MIRLSILIPTCGRSTLIRTLESVSPLCPGDEVLIARDDSNDWGATPRNRLMGQATGTHLLFMDDDDVYLPGALTAIRGAVKTNPDRPHVFRTVMIQRGLVWASRELRTGNVGTLGICVPNVPNKLGRWPPVYNCDFRFLEETVAYYPPNALVFSPEIIAMWRPQ